MSSWSRSARRDLPAAADEVGSIAVLGVLLGAGLSVRSAWAELARAAEGESQAGEVARAITRAIEAGVNPHEAIAVHTRRSSESWRALGACWAVARASGSPMAPALAALAEALTDRRRTTGQVRAALAGPRATLRLVMVLPVVGVLGASLGGMNPLGFYFVWPTGIVLVGAGVAMMGLAWWWLRLLTQRALPDCSAVSLELDLFAIAARGGASPESARRGVLDTLVDFDLFISGSDPITRLCELSRRAGVPVAGLASAQATRQRDELRTDAEERLQRLGVAIVIPLGVLVLPAFVMVAIIPMGVGLWQQALG